MAHLETVQTGFTVVTHVRGREYRNRPGEPKHPQNLLRRMNKTKQRRIVCVLSARGAEQLEAWGINQPCHGPLCSHGHHTRARITMLIESGELRWVGKGENVAAWVADLNWKGVPSGGTSVRVMQLVNGR
ncbi:MAG: hypothetical protein WB608_16210 [Terracidiphilus sp.]